MECRAHKLVADVAVFAEGCVLMVRYRDTRRYDGQSGWFLPDDYLGHGEHPDDAAVRILAEQADLSPPPELRLNHIESFDGDGSPWHLIFHYTAGLDARPAIVPGENVLAVEWFSLGALPPRQEMAHGGWAADVLDEALKRLELQA